MQDACGAPLEIERRFLCEMPNTAELAAAYDLTVSEITQTYLSPTPYWTSERVRSRTTDGVRVLTHTAKRRLSRDTAIEEERVIGEEEYHALLRLRDETRRPIEKRRIALSHAGLVFEIDIYPFWEKHAVMEVELPTSETPLHFPDFVRVIREITGDKRFSNHALAEHVPSEELLEG